MALYTAAGSKGTTSVRTIVNARADASAASRGRVYDYEVGMVTAPNATDAQFDHMLYRSSTAGTAAALTLNPNDPADAAAVNDASDTYTVDPTIGVVLHRFPMNQRATWRWVAAPGGGFVWPGTASNGICGGVLVATAVDFSATLFVDTQ